MNTSPEPSANRLFFLDWVRIVAFFLLILYHVGMYYVSWDWHVKSPFAGTAIEPLMMLSSPWRLSLLFLVSGVASGFMLTKIGTGKFMRLRSWRLLVPLVFGMVVIVPPQPYFEVIEKLAYTGSYGDFMQLYLRAYHGFCKDGKCLDLPTWNHLWFVAYLWVYTLVLGVVALSLGERLGKLAQAVGKLLTGWKILVLPLAVLAIARLALLSAFPQTHGLYDDWYNHAHYFFLFLLGALMCREAGFWRGVGDLRWMAFGLALFCWATLMVYFSLPEAVHETLKDSPWRYLMRSVYAACEWTAIVAACGFAQRLLNFDSAKRRYLTEAVFPVYILHQTLIVSMAHLMKPAGMPPVLEGAVLVILTLCLSFGVFEVVRRVPVLRPLFGLGPRATAAAPRVTVAGDALAAH